MLKEVLPVALLMFNMPSTLAPVLVGISLLAELVHNFQKTGSPLNGIIPMEAEFRDAA